MKRVAFSNAFNADFKEEKHKRDKDGKFSNSGSGGSSSKSKGGEYAQDAANGEPKKGSVVLEINVPKGTKTANLSGEADINSNNEVILGRDSNIKVSSVTKKGGETYVTVDLVKAQPAPKSEPKGSPPEPVSKVYRKQVETLIKSDAKEAKTLESLYSKLLSAKTAEEQSKLKGEVNKVVKKIKGLNIRPLNLRG